MGVTLFIACKQGDPTGRPAPLLPAEGLIGVSYTLLVFALLGCNPLWGYDG